MLNNGGDGPRLCGDRGEQPYVAVDTSPECVSVIRDIVDHILDYITVHIHMVHTVVTVFK